MKIFNVKLSVQINELGDLPEAPPEAIPEKFNDDPLDKADKMLTKHFNNLGIGRPIAVMAGMYPGENNAVSLSLNFNIIAADFEEVQRILAKFHSTATEIHESRPAPPPQALAVGGMG